MSVKVTHYVPVLLSKCQILNCIVRESNPGPPSKNVDALPLSYGICAQYGCARHTLSPSTSLQMPNIELHRPGIELSFSLSTHCVI